MRFFYCHFIRRRHEPKRHPLGGFRCSFCSEAGESLDEMGFEGQGYVPPIRRLYSRERNELTRTAHWEPTRRGH